MTDNEQKRIYLKHSWRNEQKASLFHCLHRHLFVGKLPPLDFDETIFQDEEGHFLIDLRKFHKDKVLSWFENTDAVFKSYLEADPFQAVALRWFYDALNGQYIDYKPDSKDCFELCSLEHFLMSIVDKFWMDMTEVLKYNNYYEGDRGFDRVRKYVESLGDILLGYYYSKDKSIRKSSKLTDLKRKDRDKWIDRSVKLVGDYKDKTDNKTHLSKIVNDRLNKKYGKDITPALSTIRRHHINEIISLLKKT